MHECDGSDGDVGCVDGVIWYADFDFGMPLGKCQCECHNEGTPLHALVETEQRKLKEEQAEQNAFDEFYGRYA